jgi:hypothetical protein
MLTFSIMDVKLLHLESRSGFASFRFAVKSPQDYSSATQKVTYIVQQ